MDPASNRIATFRAFEQRFRKPRGYPAPPAPVPVSSGAVDAVEWALQCRIPASYRQFVTQVGPCEVRGLSDWWMFNPGEPDPFESMWSPAMIEEQVKHEWLAPIPGEVSGGDPIVSAVAWKYLVPFASDGGGNWHCFRRTSQEAGDAPVYFFDHDGGDIEQIAAGLEQLIYLYMRILPGEEK